MRPYYADDAVTIYHGDCRDIMPGLAFDCVVTDPPYGIGFPARPTNYQRWAGRSAEHWDATPADVAFLLATDRPTCIWGGNYFPLPPARGWLVWTKPDAPPSMGSAEFAWTNVDQNARHISHSISATNAERVAHPTQKPLRVMAWCISLMPPGMILDPFAGSGTTLVAAKDLGRRAIGIEIEERYCELAARRCAQEVLDLKAG